jgi:hypothetical protein
MKNIILCIVSGILVVGCEQKVDLQKLAEDATSLIESNVDRLKGEFPSQRDLSKMSEQELNRLLSFEYLIFDYETPPTATALEGKLNQLGAERWECIATPAFDKPVRIQCKRPAKVLLRYALSRLF